MLRQFDSHGTNSGKCFVIGGAGEGVGECLRRQGTYGLVEVRAEDSTGAQRDALWESGALWEGADDASQAAGLVQAAGRGDVSGPGLLHHPGPRRGRDVPGTASSPERR